MVVYDPTFFADGWIDTAPVEAPVPEAVCSSDAVWRYRLSNVLFRLEGNNHETSS